MINPVLINRFLKARRAFIAGEFSNLNNMQKEAVMATEGPLLLLAGAGSGKTTVIINRIANLLKYGCASDSDIIPDYITDDDVEFLEKYIASPSIENYQRAANLCTLEPAEPWRVMAITFTNKAADELKTRLENMLGPEAGDVWAMTFHSACVRILRRDIERLGYSRSFTIYDTADSQSVIKRVLKELEMDEKTFPYRSVLNSISKAKDSMLSPQQFMAVADHGLDLRKKYIAKAYFEYQKRLKEANAVDFDDIILLTVRLLIENEDIREYYQQRFKYVLIDEYQDTNNLQYLFASTIAGGRKNICVVGDDDQSIYKFRGATIENILNFEQQYKNTRVIRLEQNYRSTGNILDASNAVIRNNHERKGKELWTSSENGEKLRHYIAGNESEEAQFVASQILGGFSAGKNWRDFAVLYRMNAQSNQFEYAFKRNGIPYRVIGGMRFYERAEVKDMLAYLCTVNNPSDDLRLLRIINNPPRGIGTKTIETVRELALSSGRSVYEIIRNVRNYDELSKSAPKLAIFANLIDELREAAAYLPPDELYDLLLERSGYISMLREKDTDENASRIENVNELKTNIVEYMKNTDTPSLAAFLDEVALYTDIEQYDSDGNCVNMMTIHSAKGLEFDTVFIVGAEDGIFPGNSAIGEPGEMEEERRLCYVAMTRAKRKLCFTSARQRMIFGHTSANKTSRFIDEIPDDYINKAQPRRQSGYSSSYNRTSAPSPVPAHHITRTTEKPIQSTSFSIGDNVNHRAFGKGTIVSLRPMGSDALIEIEFETTGKKKLMLKTASQSMEKIQNISAARLTKNKQKSS